MKKRMLKIIATVLSLVLVFMSVSLATSAEEAGKYPVVTGAEDFDLCEVMINKSETVFLTRAEHNKDKYSTLLASDDLIAYDEIDIMSALPEDTEYFEVVHYTVKDDLFVFVVFLYDLEVGFDENDQGYIEQVIYLGTQIVTTTDFVDYESYAFTINQDNPEVFWELENYGDFASFGYVGDTFVYANTDCIVTKETDLEVKGKGIYYTTTDFVNWKICYTPEVVLYSVPHEGNLVLPGIYSYYSIKYTVLKNSLVFDLIELEIEEDPFGKIHEYTSLTLTYVTSNFKDYKNVFKASDSLKYYSCSYYYLKGQPDSVFMLKEYNKASDDKGYMAIVSADIKSGTLKTVYGETSRNYMDVYATEDGLYFNVWDEASGSYVYEFNGDLKYSKGLGMDSLEGYYGYVMNDKLYMRKGNEIYVFDDGQRSEYRFSPKQYEGYTLDKLFALESGVVALAENTKTKETVLIDGIKKTGDADFDNKVNSGDALKILQDATSLLTLSDEARAVADVDENGELNSNDALKVLQYSTGLILSLA